MPVGSVGAHGATLDVNADSVTITPSILAGALGREVTKVDVEDITGVSTVSVPTSYLCGLCVLSLRDGDSVTVSFGPNNADTQRSFVTQIQAALRGEAPVAPAIVGLNFVAVDVETANDDWGSICQIGVTHVVDGNCAETKTWLCQPPKPIEHFDEFNISIHGITAQDVANSPRFAEVLPEVIAEIGSQPVVAHNAQFDMTAFLRACSASDITPPPWIFGCSLALARAAKLGIENHRLPTVARHFGFEMTKHHDAGADAQACAEIIIGLAKACDFTGGFVDFFDNRGFATGELRTDRVYPVLKKPGQPAPSSVSEAKEAAPENTNKNTRNAPWAKVATPDVAPEANENADPTDMFFEQNITLTGDFEPFDKGMLWTRLAERGATIGKNVTKKTTMLVIGPWASVTSKQKRAEELRDKGQDIIFLTADELFTELGLNKDEQPPF